MVKQSQTRLIRVGFVIYASEGMAVLCCQPAMLLHLQDAPVRCYIETTMQHQSAHASDRKGFVIHLGCSECIA